MSFICQYHRQRFSQNPSQAKREWGLRMRQTMALYDKNHYADALPHIGSCYDISTLLIEIKELPGTMEMDNYQRLSLSIYGLSKCLRLLGEKQVERHYLLNVHYLLANEDKEHGANSIEFEKAYQTSLQLLKKHYQFYGENNPFDRSARLYDQKSSNSYYPFSPDPKLTQH